MARTKRDNVAAAPEMQRIALEFSKFREDNNLSQKFLAEIIGVVRRTIQNIESGTIIPHAATLKKFEELKMKYAAEGKSAEQETANVEQE